MRPATSRVTTQGQVSVPASIRRHLALGPGAVIEWEVTGDQVIVRRVGRFTSEDVHRALFDEVPAAKSLEEMKRGIAEHVRRRHARR
jgi:AbrB family looped-hinge helix DNA binding protein